MDDAKVDAYLQHGPRMVDFFHQRTEVKFVAGLAIPDFHPEAPGGAVDGSSAQRLMTAARSATCSRSSGHRCVR